jgi:predicted RNA-binding Zn-ribbon protein involved in translation (DUF1610 family)
VSNQILERFHRALIEEIQTHRPEYLTGPFTVAEIYQSLVPYGSHRDRIGVEMNGDYEDALVRLLAGEGGYLVLDSDVALQALREELKRVNPNTGFYREFAAVDVRLNQAYLDLSDAARNQLPDIAEELEVKDSVIMTDPAPAADLGMVPPSVDILSDPEPIETSAAMPASGEEAQLIAEEPQATRVSAPATSSGGLAECRSCGGDLPAVSSVNFCPFCGSDQTVNRCRSCGSELEPGWDYCPSCGARADGIGGG